MADIIERDGLWTLDKSDSWDGAEIVVAATGGGVTVSVAEEQAMDSYNQTFTCTMSLTREEAGRLGLFLIRLAALTDTQAPR